MNFVISFDFVFGRLKGVWFVLVRVVIKNSRKIGRSGSIYYIFCCILIIFVILNVLYSSSIERIVVL